MAEPALEPKVAFPIEAIDKPGRLVNFTIANTLRREVSELLGRNDTRFPGAQPVSFVRRHLDELRQHELVYPFL
jgi:mRNA guanylyltransferase